MPMTAGMPHDVEDTVPPGTCLIRGGQVMTVRRSEVAELARQPTPAGGPSLPPRFLRHADEQTVVGMRAVLQTLAEAGSDADDLTFDAVVAASCRAGQPTAARTMVALQQQGPVGVTPHVVPQCSLHSPASAVSVGLGMHGPTIGVGGGPAALAEGLLSAATLAMSLAVTQPAAAIWLIVTGWDAPPALDDEATPTNDSTCRGLALCLKPLVTGTPLPEAAILRIDSCSSQGSPDEFTGDLPLWEFCERLTQGRATHIGCGRGLKASLIPGEMGFGFGTPATMREAA
ncbi:MAG: hypothetical protein RLZZ622_783 [Planctomycetota bacterium]|jgi:hypothetical protein